MNPLLTLAILLSSLLVATGSAPAADPSLADEISRHRKLLEQWRAQTHDESGEHSAAKPARRVSKKS